MSGTALLIGAALDGLTGVENDVEAMAGALEARGLAVRRCLGAQATRAGILTAYERLIADTGPLDAAVIFYSGHGGLVRPPAAGTPGPDPRDLQFIVPTDFHSSGPDDFRGITSVELSALLERLTRKTANATVVLDCCHAARMSRGRAMRVKAVPRLAPYDRLRAHVDRLRREGALPAGPLRTTGNPDAVRIVACAPDQSAFEYEGEDGRQIGMLTEALVKALGEAGTEQVTWASVMDRVRRRVLSLAPGQRPEAEGPARRLLFELAKQEPLTTLRVTAVGQGRVRLECAALLGVQRGDAFTVMPPGTAGPAETDRVGEVRVDRVGPLVAEGPVRLASGWTRIPLGARAYRAATSAPALPILLPEDPRTRTLTHAVALAPLLRTAESGEQWLAMVRIDEAGRLTVEDRIGPLHAPRPCDGDGIARVLRDLKALAQANMLRGLVAPSEWALGAPVVVEWGLVRAGERSPLARNGAVVGADSRVYISIRNDSGEALYVSMVDIGVSGRVSVITDFAPSGVRIDPGMSYVYGFDDLDRVLLGEPFHWPEGVDPAHARPETVLLLVTAQPQDVSALGQGGAGRASPGRPSPLGALLDQISTGGVRDLPPAVSPAERYDVHTLDFDLQPPADRPTFLIEERPRGPVLRGVTGRRVPTAVAVRLEELVIHHNRAIFGADVRVDALVLTGAGRAAGPVYAAGTERFSRIRDGDLLPLDRLLVYHGPVRDYLDLAVWVCRDAPNGIDLKDLISESLDGFEIRDALAKLGEASAAAPHAAAEAALVGTGALFVHLAYRLLRETVGNVIGLYRGSLLAQERFGVGRHPASGARRVQDYSLAYSVEEV